jgi:acetolactate decarboxylase
VTGTFDHIKVRALPRQKKPYPKLAEVAKTEPAFEHWKTEGTLVGFRIPGYMDGLNQPGYHFHFISADRTFGGQVLEATVGGSRLEIETIRDYTLKLPRGEEFERAGINKP